MNSQVELSISVPVTTETDKFSARRRRRPHAWLGASALAVGVGVSLAGAAAAHADNTPPADSSPSGIATAATASLNNSRPATTSTATDTVAGTVRAHTRSVSAGRAAEAGRVGGSAANLDQPIARSTPSVNSAPGVTSRTNSAVLSWASAGSVPHSTNLRASTQPVPGTAAPVAVAKVDTDATRGASATRAPLLATAVMVSDSGAVASVFNSRAVAAVPSGLLWQANTAVVNWFDNSANWLAGLPANPVGDLLQVGLVMVRRSLFNQAPTTEPMQIKTLVNGQILGTLGAVDPEGDTLSYTLTRIPQEGVISGIYREPAGTVQISPDGSYIYTPGDDFSGYDTFTVTVNDGGFNILDPSGNWRSAPANVTVVGLETPAGLPDVNSAGAAITRSLTIQNLTGSTLELTGFSATRDVENVAPIGTILQPGESTSVTLAQYAFVNNRSTLELTRTTGPTQRFFTYFDLEPFATNWGCNGKIDNCETSGSTTSGTAKLLLLDAPGTVISVPSGQGQKQ
ncbi:MAG: Ig-like domain-containing protein, partial [Mycobacterium sp.]